MLGFVPQRQPTLFMKYQVISREIMLSEPSSLCQRLQQVFFVDNVELRTEVRPTGIELIYSKKYWSWSR